MILEAGMDDPLRAFFEERERSDIVHSAIPGQ